MLKRVLFFMFFIVCFILLNAQVLSVFAENDDEFWRSEGDGYYELDELGNPGYCFRVNDYATGNINYAIAPLKFTGDWSSATASDSLYYDLKVVTPVTSYASAAWAFEISGPAGTARFIPIDDDPPLNTWTYYSAKLDSLEWDIVDGYWNAILSDVDLFRVRAEYIDGDEYVLMDNILLSISPTIQAVTPLVVTNFEDGTYDGWLFEDVGGVSIVASGGNPGKYCRITDGSGVSSQAVAPPKFLGDWSQLDESAVFMVDFRSNKETLSFSDFLFKISGPGGEAVIPMDNSLANTYNKWETYSYLISDTVWTLNSGTWSSLLNQVDEFRLIPEFSPEIEIIWMDNIRISNDRPIANFTADEVYICPGRSVQFEDISVYAPTEWLWDFGDTQVSIEEDPVHIYEDTGMYDVRLIVSNNFGCDTLLVEDYIEVESLTDSILFCDDFDDSEIHPFWDFRNGSWSETSGNISQTTNYYSTGWINGCFAYTGCSVFSDYEVSMDFRSTDNDGIGAIFYYQDENNFYLFVWRAEINYRALLKFENGIETELASDTNAYTTGDWYNLDITVGSGNIVCSIDDTEIFNIYDTTFLMGKAGLYCWANDNSYWDNFCIKRISSLSSPLNAQISENLDQVSITWVAVAGATSYKIYSSDEPNTSFTEETDGTFSGASWTKDISGIEKKFYYVKAVN